MIRAELGLGILGTALWVYCLLDVIMADDYRVRNLSKGTWIFIVLVTNVVGAVAWLLLGRPESAPRRGLPYKGNHGTAAYPEYDRPGRATATNPDDDEEFLRRVRERAEAQMREARRQREERERAERERAERERAARRARERELEERRRAAQPAPEPDPGEAPSDGQPADAED